MTKPIITFTGGHHNSSLVIAKELLKQDYGIVWIGHKYTMSGDKKVSAEYLEVTRAGIPFHELKTGKIYKKLNPLEYLKLIMGFSQAFIYLLNIRPQLIFSSGGYLSVPVVVSGWLLGIPVVTHEQTVTAGWANRVVAKFAQKIFLTHTSSLKDFPRSKSVVTGLPLRKGLLTSKGIKITKPPTIYITCGKQGSHIINQAVFPLIPSLIENFRVIHQTGAHSNTPDQDKARRLKASLPPKFRSRYIHKGYFFETEATRFLKSSSLIISRAGAHTVYEILLLNKRAILIPISWVSHNEQQKNAEIVVKNGLGIVLPESELSPKKLQQTIDEALKLKPSKGIEKNIIADATERIVEEIKPFLVK